MSRDWTTSEDLGGVEGMSEQAFCEHVRRQSIRISRAAIAGKLAEADRLASALTADAVNRARRLGAPIEDAARYDLGSLGEWLDRSGRGE